jgi:putative membrane protein
MGGIYEIFEWTLTLTLAPADAGAYNGEQGDMFDAQKDMALAALGALLALPFAQRTWPERTQ